jgi:hypothetical protein
MSDWYFSLQSDMQPAGTGADKYGCAMRVSNASGATTWDSEEEARQAMRDLGVAGDPEVFVAEV